MCFRGKMDFQCADQKEPLLWRRVRGNRVCIGMHKENISSKPLTGKIEELIFVRSDNQMSLKPGVLKVSEHGLDRALRVLPYSWRESLWKMARRSV